MADIAQSAKFREINESTCVGRKNPPRHLKRHKHVPVSPQSHTLIAAIRAPESNFIGHRGWPAGWLCVWANSELVFDFDCPIFLTQLKLYCANLEASPRCMQLECSESPNGPFRLVHSFEMADRIRQPRHLASNGNRLGLACETYCFIGAPCTLQDPEGLEHPINNKGTATSPQDIHAREESFGCARYWKFKFEEDNGGGYIGINDCSFWGVPNPLPPPVLHIVEADADREVIRLQWLPIEGRDVQRYVVVGYVEGMSREGGFEAGSCPGNSTSFEFDTPEVDVPYCFQVVPVGADGVEGMPSLCSDYVTVKHIEMNWVLVDGVANDFSNLSLGNDAVIERTTLSEDTGGESKGGEVRGEIWGNEEGVEVAEKDEMKTFRGVRKTRLPKAPTTVEEYVKDYRKSFTSILTGDFEEIEYFPVATSVCVFVSSTFDDTLLERNYLSEIVFPELSKFCKARSLDFEVVDLRWGIRDESTDDHETIDICLREVRRCLKRSTAAAFFFISGERYGWRALPNRVEASEFEIIMNQLPDGSEGKECCLQWYLKDENSSEGMYVLQSISSMRERGGQFANFWDDNGGAECVMQNAIRDVLDICDLSPSQKSNWRISVTEREVTEALNSSADVEMATICFMRTIENLCDAVNQEAAVSREMQHAMKYYTPLEADRVMLGSLRDRIKSLVSQDLLREYTVQWDHDGCFRNSLDYLRQFGADFINDLEARIRLALSYRPALTDMEKEYLHHCIFAFKRSQGFTGRTALINTICSRFYGRDAGEREQGGVRTVKAIHGVSGSGKTSTMCHIACKTSVVLGIPGAVTMIRMCGTSSYSASVRDILRTLCLQIIRVYDVVDERFDSVEVAEFEVLVESFHELMTVATETKPLAIFIDSLDQLDDSDNGRSQPFKWLPKTLPDHVYFTISTLPDSSYGILDALRLTLPPHCFAIIEPIRSTTEAYAFLVDVLSLHNRVVASDAQEKCIKTCLDTSVERSAGFTMLHLKLLCDRIMKWRHYREVDSTPEPLPTNVEDLIRKYYCELELAHGAKFVALVFRLLLSSASGLSRENLIDLVSAHDDVLGQKGEKDAVLKYHDPPIRRLPPLVLSRLLNDLGQYCVQRGQNGTVLLSLYHRQFFVVARDRYLESQTVQNEMPNIIQAMGSILADYFSGKLAVQHRDRLINKHPWFYSDGEEGTSTASYVNIQKIVELPHALFLASRYNDLVKLLCNLEYIEAKFAAGAGFGSELMMEYTAVRLWLEEHSDSANCHALTQYYHFVSKWFNALALNASLTNPLAMNSHRTDNVVYDSAHARWSAGKESRSFIAWKNSPQLGDACLFTRACYPFLTSCRFSSDGSKFVVAGQQKCSVFSTSMKMLSTFSGHRGWVRGCCFSPDGMLVCSVSAEDCKGYVWDVSKAECIATLVGHYNWILGVDWCKVNNRILTVSKDCTGTVWNPQNGERMGVLLHHTGPVNAGTFTPNGARICTVSSDGMAVIWCAKLLQPTIILEGHRTALLCVCVSPNGSSLAVGAENKTVYVWNLKSKQLHLGLKGHTGEVLGVVFSPNSSEVLSVSSDHIGIVHSTAIGKQECGRLGGHGGWVLGADWYSDSLLTVSEDGCAKIWSRNSLQAEGEVIDSLFTDHHGVSGSALHFSADGNRLDVLCKDLTAKAYSLDRDSGTLTLLSAQPARHQIKTATKASCSDDGKFWTICQYSSEYNILNTSDGSIHARKFPVQICLCVCQWDPSNSDRLMLGGHGSSALTMGIQTLSTPKIDPLICAMPLNEWAYDCAWSLSGNRAAIACSKGVRVYDVSLRGVTLRAELCTIGTTKCALSADGRVVMCTASNGALGYSESGPEAFVYDVDTGEEMCKLDMDCTNCTGCVLSADGANAYLMFAQRGTKYFTPALLRFNTSTGKVEGCFLSPWNDEFKSLAIAPTVSPSLLAIGDSIGRVFIVQHQLGA